TALDHEQCLGAMQPVLRERLRAACRSSEKRLFLIIGDSGRLREIHRRVAPRQKETPPFQSIPERRRHRQPSFGSAWRKRSESRSRAGSKTCWTRKSPRSWDAPNRGVAIPPQRRGCLPPPPP